MLCLPGDHAMQRCHHKSVHEGISSPSQNVRFMYREFGESCSKLSSETFQSHVVGYAISKNHVWFDIRNSSAFFAFGTQLLMLILPTAAATTARQHQPHARTQLISLANTISLTLRVLQNILTPACSGQLPTSQESFSCSDSWRRSGHLIC